MVRVVILIVIIVAIMYFFLFAMQRRRSKQTKNMSQVADYKKIITDRKNAEKKRNPHNSKYITKYNSSEDYREK